MRVWLAKWLRRIRPAVPGGAVAGDPGVDEFRTRVHVDPDWALTVSSEAVAEACRAAEPFLAPFRSIRRQAPLLVAHDAERGSLTIEFAELPPLVLAIDDDTSAAEIACAFSLGGLLLSVSGAGNGRAEVLAFWENWVFKVRGIPATAPLGRHP